jgi:hypothetical protein
MSLFNVKDVKEKADAALLIDVEDAREIYAGEIMDWTDYYTETYNTDTISEDSLNCLKSIANLWIASCNMEISLKQFKKTEQLFKNALEDNIVMKSFDIYKAYADFCKSRNKNATAQNVYIKGLCANLIEKESDELWIALLSMLRLAKGKDIQILKLTTLFEEVEATLKKQASEDMISPPSISLYSMDLDTIESSSCDMSVAESKVDSPSKSPTNIENSSTSIGKIAKRSLDSDTSINNSSILINNEVKGENITQLSSSSITTVPAGLVGTDEWDDVSSMSIENLRKSYLKRPTMLFTSPYQEPMSLGLQALSNEEILELENYFGIDMISISTGSTSRITEMVLDIVEALWSSQALKERHFDSWFSDLQKIQEKEERALKQNFTQRETQREPDIKKTINIEMKKFHTRCDVRREILFAVVNKTMFSLLIEQIKILSEIKFPHFTPKIVEKIEMISSCIVLGNDIESELKVMKRFIGSFLSLRNLGGNRSMQSSDNRNKKIVNNYSNNSSVKQMMKPITPSFSRGLSEDVLMSDNTIHDFLSDDAKKKRKKRRKLSEGEGSLDGSLDSLLSSVANEQGNTWSANDNSQLFSGSSVYPPPPPVLNK